MPTTARLVAALMLAGLGWGVSILIVTYLPPETQVGWFGPVAAGFGLIVGWSYTGRRLDRGRGKAVSVGLTSVLTHVFWVLLTFSIVEMVRRSLRKSYDNPPEAVVDVFRIAVDYLVVAAQIDVVLALLIGAVVVGVVTQRVAARFR
ncbi:TrgA family protein [Maritimibacter fusiformis]|nr:TrgA family protein [Maritimibacter fusiformis]